MCFRFLSVLMFIKIVQESVAVSPRNVAVVAGQRVEMECSAGNGTKIREWSLRRIGMTQFESIWTNWDLQPNRIDQNFTHFGVEVDENGSFRIYSNAVRLEDAGVHACSVHSGNSQPIKHSAHLIVLESEPKCQENSSDASLQFQCTVNYRGYLKPSMRWKLHCHADSGNQKEKLLTDEIEFIDSGNYTLTSEVNITVGPEQNSCYVSCKTFFEWQNSSEIEIKANNTPEYSYTWNSSKISCNSSICTFNEMTRSEIKKTEITTAIDHKATTGMQQNFLTFTEMTRSEIKKTEMTTAIDHKATTDSLNPTSALIAALIIACIIAVVCSVCCIVCICCRRKLSDLMFRLANYLQGGIVDRRDKTFANNVDGNSSWRGSVLRSGSKRRSLPKIPLYEHTLKITTEEPMTPITAGATANEVYNCEPEGASNYARLSREICLADDDSDNTPRCQSIYSADPSSSSVYNLKRQTLTGNTNQASVATSMPTTRDRSATTDNTYATVTNSVYDTTIDDTYSDID